MKFSLLHPFWSMSAIAQKAIEPAPLDKKIAADMRVAQKKIMDFDHTIRLQQFGKHMAEAEIQAMIAWVELERASVKVVPLPDPELQGK